MPTSRKSRPTQTARGTSSTRPNNQNRQQNQSRAVPSRGVAKWSNPSKPSNQNNVYTLSEFVENLRGYCGLESKAQAKTLCDDIARLIKDCMKRSYTIPLFGLGKLFVRQTKARMTRNPQTGEMMKVPARKRIRFSPNKVLKDLVK